MPKIQAVPKVQTFKRLNLGAGDTELPGFEARDGKKGDCIYPLPDEDDSIYEIRASHVLEHFSHTQVQNVVNHWVSKLAPGGLLKIAVPDFEYIAKRYYDGEAINVQGYTMGGQVDESDFHKCIFDSEVLAEVLLDAGLERIHRWESELKDCAALPVSLNLAGYKPLSKAMRCEETTAVLSAPRFGPVMHFRYAHRALGNAGVPYQIAGGAYWAQVITEIMAEQAEKNRYVLTADYDTIFRYEDVMELYRLMEAQPEIDALCSLQAKRGSDHALFGMRDENGRPITKLPQYNLLRNTMKVAVGHFGLTMFRAETLRKHPHPWMEAKPDKDGRWGDEKIDADINFWVKWKKEGRTLYLAPRVIVGHLEEMIRWPTIELTTIHQTVSDYDTKGIPLEALRCLGNTEQ